MPCTIIRWAVSSTRPAPGIGAREEPSSTKTNENTNARKKFVITPAAETRMSPRTYFRYFRGFTGTGLAPPKVNRPLDPNQSSAGSSEAHPGIDVGNRVQRDAAEEVGGVVALAERGGGVGVLVRRHGEHEHRKGEDEFAELGFQVAFLFGGDGGRLNDAAGDAKSKQRAA